MPKRLIQTRLDNDIPDRYRHDVRYFGLLAPRVKNQTHDAVFALFGQKRLGKPSRLSCATSLQKTFGVDQLPTGPQRPEDALRGPGAAETRRYSVTEAQPGCEVVSRNCRPGRRLCGSIRAVPPVLLLQHPNTAHGRPRWLVERIVPGGHPARAFARTSQYLLGRLGRKMPSAFLNFPCSKGLP